jgi:hypothetical protein
LASSTGMSAVIVLGAGRKRCEGDYGHVGNVNIQISRVIKFKGSRQLQNGTAKTHARRERRRLIVSHSPPVKAYRSLVAAFEICAHLWMLSVKTL